MLMLSLCFLAFRFVSWFSNAAQEKNEEDSPPSHRKIYDRQNNRISDGQAYEPFVRHVMSAKDERSSSVIALLHISKGFVMAEESERESCVEGPHEDEGDCVW